jgi:hypothetical protein
MSLSSFTIFIFTLSFYGKHFISSFQTTTRNIISAKVFFFMIPLNNSYQYTHSSSVSRVNFTTVAAVTNIVDSINSCCPRCFTLAYLYLHRSYHIHIANLAILLLEHWWHRSKAVSLSRRYTPPFPLPFPPTPSLYTTARVCV